MNFKKMAVGTGCGLIILTVLLSQCVGRGISLWSYQIYGISASALSDDGKRFLVGCEDGYYFLFDQFGNMILDNTFERKIYDVDIAENGNMLFGIENGAIVLDDMGIIKSNVYSATPVLCVSMASNGLYAVAGTQKNVILMSTREFMWQFRIEDGDSNSPEISVSRVAISESGSIVAAAVQSEVFIFNSASAVYMEKIDVGSTITSLEISPGTNHVIIGTKEGTLFIYDTKEIKVFPYHLAGSINSIAVNSEQVLVGTSEGEIILFNQDGDILLERKTEGSVIACDVSSNRKFMIILDSKGNISFFNTLTERGWNSTVRDPVSVEISKNGKYIGITRKIGIFFLNDGKNIDGTEYFPYTSHGLFSLEDDLYKVWSYQAGGNGGFDYGDVNGDGMNEVVFGSDTELVILNHRGELVWSKSFSSNIDFVCLHDLTEDTVPEIIIGFDDGLLNMNVWSGKGECLASFDFMNIFGIGAFQGDMSIVTAMDIDQDGIIEIISRIRSEHPLKPRGIFVFEYPSGEKEWFYPFAPFELCRALTDINNDGNLELVLGSQSSCSGNMIGNKDDCQVYATVIDLEGNEIWTKQVGFGLRLLLVGVSDLDGNGQKEIVGTVGSSDNTYGKLFILDNKGNYVYERELDHSIWLGGIADFEDDGVQEIVVTNSKGEVLMYNHNLTLLRKFEAGNNINPYVKGIADLNGDRSLEIIFVTDGGEFIILNNDFVELVSMNFDKDSQIMFADGFGCAIDLLVRSFDKIELYSMKKERRNLCSLIEEENRRKKVVKKESPQEEAERYFEAAKTCYKNLEFDSAVKNYEEAKQLFVEIQSISGVLESSWMIERTEKLQKALRKLIDGQEKLIIGNSKNAGYCFLESKLIFETLLQDENYDEVKNWLQTQITKCEGWLDSCNEVDEALKNFTNGKKELVEGDLEEARGHFESALQISEEYGLEELNQEILKYLEDIEKYQEEIDDENKKKRYFSFLVLIFWILEFSFLVKLYKSISMIRISALSVFSLSMILILVYLPNITEIIVLVIFLVAVFMCWRYLPNMLYRNENHSTLESLLYTSHMRRFPTFSLISNPYDTVNPIKEENMFFGREDLFEFLMKRVTSSDKNSFIILHGEYRTGKTSFLFQIENGKFDLGPEFIPVYVDMSGMIVNNDYEFLSTLASAIRETFDLYQMRIPVPRLNKKENLYLYFKNNFIQEVVDSAGGKRIVFLVDEYELIGKKVADGKLSKDVFSFLRSMIEHGTKLDFIFAGSRNIDQLENIEEWNLIRSASDIEEISFLKREDAIKLIRNPMAEKVWYTQRAINELLSLSGCHPYILQCFCFALIVLLNETSKYTIDIGEVEKVVQNMIKNPTPQLRYMWKDLTKDQQKIVSFLAGIMRKKSGSLSQEKIVNMMKKKNIELHKDAVALLLDLKDKGILKKEKNKYWFCVDIFRRFTAEHYPLSRVLQEVGI